VQQFASLGRWSLLLQYAHRNPGEQAAQAYFQVRFCRYRFSPTGELKYRGKVAY
jgi:hypothetical protein